MADFRLTKDKPSIDGQRLSAKDKISYLYNQISTDSSSNAKQSSFGLSCSDQKLVLFDIMKTNKIDNQPTKPKNFNEKLKEAKRNLINNTKDDSSVYLLSNANKLSKFPKAFQEKYCELAKCAGTEMKPTKKHQTTSSVDLKHYTPSRPLESDSKVNRLKKEILSSIKTDGHAPVGNLNKFQFKDIKVNLDWPPVSGKKNR